MEHSTLNSEIEKLRYLFIDAKSGNARWSDVWAQVVVIRRGFKDIRYPSRQQRDDAWNRFQSILSEVEAQKEQAGRDRATLAASSQRTRADIENLIHSALTFDPTASDIFINLFGLVIPGVNIGLMFEGPIITRKKKILLTRSKFLKDAWETFKSHKEQMIAADRGAVFGQLKHAQDVLDREWEEWKDAQEKYFNEQKAAAEIRRAEKQRRHEEYLERQRLREHRQREWEMRKADRRRRIEANIDKNVERVARLYEVLKSKAGHLARFESHRDSARSDDFRLAMEEKIESISGQMLEIKSKIEQVEQYIEEDRQKLRDMS